jgi:hypothetical protein
VTATNSFDAMVTQLTGGLAARSAATRRAKACGLPVFTLKRGERVASGTDVHKRALVMRAALLQGRGDGGGIVSLLLPKTPKEAKRLIRDLKSYDLHLVKLRAPIRFKAAREQLRSSEFLWLLIEICPATDKWKLIDFAKWLHAEMSKPGSSVRTLAARHAPKLLGASRSFSWLYRNLRKMSR